MEDKCKSMFYGDKINFADYFTSNMITFPIKDHWNVKCTIPLPEIMMLQAKKTKKKKEFWAIYAQTHVNHSHNSMFQKFWWYRTDKRSLKNKFTRKSSQGRDLEEWGDLNMNRLWDFDFQRFAKPKT